MTLSDLEPHVDVLIRFVLAHNGFTYAIPVPDPSGFGYLAFRRRNRHPTPPWRRRRTWIGPDEEIDPNGTHWPVLSTADEPHYLEMEP